MEISKENITTIATLLYVIIAPIITKYLGANIDEATFIGVIGFIIALISAKHPNTFKFLENDAENQSKNSEAKTTEENTETNNPETLEDTLISDEGA